MSTYNHKQIEKKWQERWEKERVFEVSDKVKKDKKKYILDMFPYPSGAGLHVGHPEGYTATDIYSRYLRMKGFDVLHPMGWDAFGLPAENYAIKKAVHPKESMRANIETFRRQLKSLGFSYDWPREISTCDPDYYKWTQWLFLQLYKAGLAYKKEAPVNWCESCKTVLANEQVINGACERCHNKVEQKNLEQWFFKITGESNKEKGISNKGAGKSSYPERLLDNLDKLDWPEPIKTMQRNWIGRSEGAMIKFQVVIAREGTPDRGNPINTTNIDNRENNTQRDDKIASSSSFALGTELRRTPRNDTKIEIFTTRPDTLFGATYMVLAPEHKLIDEMRERIENWKEVEEYRKLASSKSALERTGLAKEKIGVELRGIKAINPANNEEIPIWIADYVLSSYGTGAIMAVPAHDKRDFEFAKKYNLPIRQVIESLYIQTTEPGIFRKEEPIVERESIITIVKHWSEEKYIGLQWKKVDWRTFLTGGIEKGQTAKQAGLTEIREETGYLHPKFIKELGVTHGLFYHVPKKENRLAHGHILYFELQDDAREPISDEENEKHEIKWLTVEELKEFLGPATHTYALALWQQDILTYQGGGILIDSGKFNGLDSEEAKEKITKKVGGKKAVQYKLRDWLISRQRYWGAPIPIIYCDKCAHLRQGFGGQGEWPVPEKDLPVLLPDDVDFRPHGESPLARSKSFHNVKCPNCGSPARRESDTMDTFVDSSWYFLRYANPKNNMEFASKEKIASWLPVDTYVGGAEHAVLHLMYARFFCMALHDLGFLDFEEPFTQLRNQGLILGPDGHKMSKSRGNVINPDEVVANLGADTLRMYEMFMGPLEDSKHWDTDGIIGVRRFLERVWGMQKLISNKEKVISNKPQIEIELNKTIKKVQEDIESFNFNTAVSQFMIFVNAVYKAGEISTEHFEAFLKILNPFAPHITNELWEMLGHKELIERERWPEVDVLLLAQDKVNYVAQVNGKVRATFEIESGVSEDEVAEAARKNENVAKHLEGKKIIKQIFVEDRLINFVAQ